MKQLIYAFLGCVGSAIIAALGGWDSSITTLLIFMGIDLFTGGILLPFVFKKSPKSKTGSGNSYTFWKGLCRKGMALFLVLIGNRLDLAIGVNYIRNAVIIAFIVDELISIVENAGLMGVPMPDVITKAIDVLQQKSESEGK